jgi:hypothetical protein
MTMMAKSRNAKPRVTDCETLTEIVAKLRENGVSPEDIHRHIVSVAVVDLDELNEVMRAA